MVQDFPHVNLEQGLVTLKQWEFKDSQDPEPNDFCVNMPLTQSQSSFLSAWIVIHKKRGVELLKTGFLDCPTRMDGPSQKIEHVPS